MSNKTCPVCGATIVAGQRFCGECGSRLATTQESAQAGDAAERNSVMHRPGGGSPDPFAVGSADAGFGEDDDFFSQFVPKSSAQQSQDAPAQPAAPEELRSRRSRRRFNPNVYETGPVEDVAAGDTGQVPPMFPRHVAEETSQPSAPPETAAPQQSAPAASPFEESGEPIEPKTRQMSLDDIQHALSAHETVEQSAASQHEDAREQEERARTAETWQVDPDRRRVADEATFTQLIEGLPDDPADHPISSPKYVQDDVQGDVQQDAGQQELPQFPAPQQAQSSQQAPAPAPTQAESRAESAFAPLPQAEVDPQQREQQERANAFFTDAPTERAQAEQAQRAQAEAQAAAEREQADRARAEQAQAEQEQAEQAVQQQAAAGSSMPTLPPLAQQNQQQGWAQPQPPQQQSSSQPQDPQDRELNFDSLMSEFDDSEQQSERNQQASPASTRDWRASERRAAESATAVGAGTAINVGGGTGGPGGPTGPGGSGPRGPKNGDPKYTPQEVQRRRKGVMTILIAAAAAVVLIIGAFGISALFGSGQSDPAAEGEQSQTSAGTESTAPTVGGNLGDGGPTETETQTAEPTQEPFDPVTFQSGSGNIRCQITQETGVACQLTATNFAAPAEMCQNGLYAGASVGVTTDGATYPCLTSGFGGGQALAYDTPITAGPYTCSINYSTGVNCDNGDGDGFSMEYSAGITINGDMAAEPQPEVAPVG